MIQLTIALTDSRDTQVRSCLPFICACAVLRVLIQRNTYISKVKLNFCAALVRKTVNERSNMSGDVAKIVLIPHERSHPFARRECVVREPLKVGRSVDKKRISTNNLIFDCRVLSRNHAVIRFENGKVRSRERRGTG